MATPENTLNTAAAAAPRKLPIGRLGAWFVEELRWIVRVLASSSERFYWDNGFSRAAALAYTTLLSLVPVSVLAFGLLASFAASSEHLPDVREFVLRQFVPSTVAVEEVLDYLTQFSATVSSLNALVVAFIVITSVLLINSIEYALNEIWQVYTPRTLSHRIGIYCAVIVICPVLAISAYYFTRFRVEPFLAQIGMSHYLYAMYTVLLPYLIDFVAFVSLYYLVPKAPVRFRSAVFGAAVAALLFGFAKVGFVRYIEEFSTYSRIYGAVASIPIFLIWLYLAWTIVLFGAEVAYQAQYLPRFGKLWKRTMLVVGDGRMVLAVQALSIIARAFHEGRKLPDDLEIAERLGCSSVVLKPALHALERAQIVARGDSHFMPLTLMRSPERITVEEIREALFSSSSSLHFAGELSRLFSFIHAERNLSELTLADLLELDTRQGAE